MYGHTYGQKPPSFFAEVINTIGKKTLIAIFAGVPLVILCGHPHIRRSLYIVINFGVTELFKYWGI